ncbi:MAG: diguanylate cyclase, partial [Rheinheimera sp.]|nr:diguanylate cyclase [Rheinheimera sp.]
MSLKQKITIKISAFLLSTFSFCLYASGWDLIEPYTLSAVLLCSFGALILAHVSIVKMRRYQLKLEHSEERLRLSLWGSGDELWDWNIENGKLYRSSSWLHPVALQPDSSEFPPNKAQIHPQDINRVAQMLQDHLDGKTAHFEATYRLRTADNNWTWVLDRGKAVAYGADGSPSRMTGTLKNIHQLKQTEEQLQLFARCLRTISDAVAICDTDFNILEVNPAFSKITGKARDKVLQQRFELTLYPSRFMHNIRMQLAETGSWSGEISEQRVNGETYQAELTFDQIKDEQGQVTQYVAVFSDITERKQREAELNRLARSDTLTGLPNRALFMQKLAELVSSKTEHALLVFDLDNFKKINDSLGHELGDNLLCKLAGRLSSYSTFNDKLYRLGGDEFALLFDKTNDLHQITSLAKQLLALINQ